MKRTLVAITTVLALAACDGEPASPPVLLPDGALEPAPEPEPPPQMEPEMEPEGEPDPQPEPDPEPAEPFEMPEFPGMVVAVDLNPDPDIVEVELIAGGNTLEIGDMRVPVRVYDNVLPGPLIQAKVGDEVIVRFQNKLSEPTTIHWHGLRVSDEMDGNPRIVDPVQASETFEYRFVVPEAGSFWYHPHVRANEQIEQGLYGPLVVHDPADPPVDAERYFVIDDILLDNNGRPPAYLASHPEVMHGRHGNVLLANGQVPPMAIETAEGRVERWRLVNTANARTFTLALSGARFKVIGTDGGRIAEPYEAQVLRMAVGERFDLEVTFDEPGDAVVEALVPTLNDAGDVVTARIPMYEATIAATGEAPRAIEWPAVEVPERAVDREEEMTFNAFNGPAGVRWVINGLDDPQEPIYTFDEGETVRFSIRNMQGQEHPFHLHGQWFRVLSHPDPYPVPGLKDSVLVPGNATVEIEAYFDNPGRWMAHCHILEHAELGMMSEIVVRPAE